MSCRAIILSCPTLTATHFKPRSQNQRRASSSLNLGSNLAILAARNSLCFWGCQSLIHISQGGTKKSFAACNSVDPTGVNPLPSGPPSGSSWKWILGMLVTFVVPFLTTKLGTLLKIKNEVDVAVQTVENIVDAVEKVAETVEKVAENIAEDLPAGDLKNAVLRVEHVADQIDDQTEMIGDLIDKVCLHKQHPFQITNFLNLITSFFS
ncbi:OLC1v1017322C2 [Oldenlandia corymbosa var. corymbosa]|uniref:OLC1v1017322C2 n=1 Tax=Oldenlandia corymbosa var. corymbosa TaxID=529605 RepID=A0AAV1E956_OLDCO|nr:OLC1v1017322C2 [Oldenlandia corymbosa var. corymbosa]